MNTIERTKELVKLLEKEHTLSDGEFGELFDILGKAGEDPANRDIRICGEIPEAMCTPEEAASDPRELPPEEQPVYMTDSKGNVTVRPDMP